MSGTLGGINLNSALQLASATALETAGGPTTTVVSNPLSVTALSAIQVNLGGVATALTDVLTGLAGVNSGVVAQYASASETGLSIGASGAVSNTGAIALNTGSTGVPQLAQLDLHTILQNVTGSPAAAALVSQVTALNLSIGAAAGRNFADSTCTPPQQLTREYLLAYLRLALQSTVVDNLLSSLTTSLGTLTISTDDVWDTLGDVALLGPLLAALGRDALNVSVSVNTAALTATPIPNVANSALQLNLGTGSATVDLAALLGGAYTGEISPWLNNLAPNTRLFADAALPTGAVTALLDSFVDDLIARLGDLVTLNITAGSVTGLGATGLRISGTLTQFLSGTATTTLVLLGAPIPLGALLGPLLGSLGGLVTDALDTLLRPNGVLNAVFNPLNVLLDGLFTVLTNVLVLTINGQNQAPGTVPSDLAALPANRLDTAALHVGVVGALDLLDLFIARGSSGPNTQRVV